MVLRRLKPADVSWIAVLVGVTVYEVVASRRGWELLSEAMDRYRGEGRVRDDYSEITRRIIDAIVLYLGLHLTRRWPSRVDPLHRLAGLLSR